VKRRTDNLEHPKKLQAQISSTDEGTENKVRRSQNLKQHRPISASSDLSSNVTEVSQRQWAKAKSTRTSTQEGIQTETSIDA
jgi:hypothetical protein